MQDSMNLTSQILPKTSALHFCVMTQNNVVVGLVYLSYGFEIAVVIGTIGVVECSEI